MSSFTKFYKFYKFLYVSCKEPAPWAVFAHMRGARNGFCVLLMNKKTYYFEPGRMKPESRPEAT